jgi:hypothetical protein
MKKQLLFAFIISLIGIGSINAQKIKVKKDKVLVDGTPVLNIDWSGWTLETTIMELGTDNEIVFAKTHPNGTPKYTDDDYLQIHFMTLDKGLEIADRKFGKGLVKWLFKNKVFDSSGKLNPANVDMLIKKYDEEITKRTRL